MTWILGWIACQNKTRVHRAGVTILLKETLSTSAWGFRIYWIIQDSFNCLPMYWLSTQTLVLLQLTIEFMWTLLKHFMTCWKTDKHMLIFWESVDSVVHAKWIITNKLILTSLKCFGGACKQNDSVNLPK